MKSSDRKENSGANSSSVVYEKFIGTQQDVFCILTSHGQIKFASKNAVNLFGYEVEDLIGKAAVQFLHSRDVKESKLRFAILMAFPGNRVVADYKIKNINGEYIWAECIFNNMYNIPEIEGVVLQIRDVSERKKFELLLQQSEERFKSFMNNLPAFSWLVNKEDKIVFVNHGFEKVFNCVAYDVQNKSLADFIPDHIAARLRETDQLVLSLGKEIETEEQIPLSDNELHDLIIYKFPVEQNGSDDLVGGIAVDISRQKKIEKELASQKNYLEAIAATTPGIIYVYDFEDMRMVYSTKQMEILLGYNEAYVKSLYPNAIKHLAHPDDIAMCAKFWFDHETIEDGEIRELEYRVKDVKDEWHWFYTRTAVFTRDEKTSRPKLIQGYAMDITERKKSQLNYQNIFQHAPDAIFIEDYQGIILDVNPKGCELQGLLRNEIIGKNILELTPEAEKKDVWDNFLSLVENKTNRLQASSWYRDGKKIPIEIRVNHIVHNHVPAILMHVRVL